jgi:hypothetical protein
MFSLVAFVSFVFEKNSPVKNGRTEDTVGELGSFARFLDLAHGYG